MLAFALQETGEYHTVTFSVCHHARNTMLDKSINRYKALTCGDRIFSSFTNYDVLNAVTTHDYDLPNGYNGIKRSIAFKQYSLRYNTVKAATQLCWVSSISFKKSIGSMLFPLNLQVICRCSPVLRPVLPVIPTTSPGRTACPCDTKI